MRSKPSTCEGCPLHPHGTDFSRVEGTGRNQVLVVAEASGEHEARELLPLRPHAPSGMIFEQTIRQLGLSRADFAVTNVIRCRPCNNILEGAPYESAAIEHCRPNLLRVLGDQKPRVALALGGTALRTLTGLGGKGLTISHLRGYVLPAKPEFGPGLVVVPTYHPSFIRRGQPNLRGVFRMDVMRAVKVARGEDRGWALDPARLDLPYLTAPTRAEVDRFCRRQAERQSSPSWLADHPDWALSYDLETKESASLDEDALDGFADTVIRLSQFYDGDEAIAMPWSGEWIQAARWLLKTTLPKTGHNNWLFDDRVLAAVGERDAGSAETFRPAGVVHDTLQMFHFWQPDLPAGLQFAASFARFPFPWKHLSGERLEFYGCADVHADYDLFGMLRREMRKRGVLDGTGRDQAVAGAWGYQAQVHLFRPLLADMERRGLPVHDATRLGLDTKFDEAQQQLLADLERRFPDSERGIHPKSGYKKCPKQIQGLVERDVVDQKLGPVRRFCRLEPFSPNSSPQLLRYMKAKGHPVPTDKKKAARNDDDGETTAKKELERLAAKTGDDFYLRVIEYRELGKMRGTYIAGFRPRRDTGCVHTTFTFDTATGQLSSRNPNIQNLPKHGKLAKAVRSMIRDPQGRLAVEWDFKSYHALTLGFLAESPDYMRMSRLDIHSFVAGHFIGSWDAFKIIGETDDELRARFKWFKSDPARKAVRDEKAKRSILGIGFGMGVQKLYDMNREHFESVAEAKRLRAILQDLFAPVFAWQDRIKRQAHDQQFLRNRFGMTRYFYEVMQPDGKGGMKAGEQAEQAIAFLPASEAFGNMRETMKEMDRRGVLERWRLSDTVHDSLLFFVRPEDLAEHVREVYPLMTAPSKVLVHSTLAPGGLVIDCEASAGESWAGLRDLKIVRGELAE